MNITINDSKSAWPELPDKLDAPEARRELTPQLLAEKDIETAVPFSDDGQFIVPSAFRVLMRSADDWDATA